MRPAEGLALAAALVWSALLVVAATQVPVYQSEETTTQVETGTTTTTVSQGSGTLVEENGSGILIVVAIPFLVTLLVACALWLRGSRRGAGPVAWTLVGLLACFNLLAMLSVGVFVLPVTACLAVVCALRHRRALDHVQ